MRFPFFDDPALTPDKDNRFPLFKRMVIRGVDDLFFMGLAQALRTLVNFAEQQSKLAASLLAGRYALPAEDKYPASPRRTRRASSTAITIRPATRSRSTSAATSPA